jgi:exodeoxyribonuclease VII large subunit
MLAERFADVWVEGEVSGLKSYPSGHRYFTLKDEESQIQAVCFRFAAQRLGFELESGQSVIAHGRLEVYAPSGRYQIVLDTIEPKGLGALQQAFEQLKRKLEREGLFAAGRKRALPRLPRALGIVTSPSGAAIHDMLKTLRLHRARLAVVLFPAQVQGEGAAGQIADGLDVLSRRADVEVIIVGRGGGSAEELWSFNEEVVARAIAAARVPVVTGIGHETDFTIADFVADARAATPTAAAQLVARSWEEFEAKLDEQHQLLVQAWSEQGLGREQRLDGLVRHRAFERVAGRLARARLRVERVGSSLESLVGLRLRAAAARVGKASAGLNLHNPVAAALRRRMRLQRLVSALGRAGVTAAQQRSERARNAVRRLEPPIQAVLRRRESVLVSAAARLGALSPLASLGRGYAICQKQDRSVVSSRTQVCAGELVSIRVADGSFGARVGSDAATGDAPVNAQGG